VLALNKDQLPATPRANVNAAIWAAREILLRVVPTGSQQLANRELEILRRHLRAAFLRQCLLGKVSFASAVDGRTNCNQ